MIHLTKKPQPQVLIDNNQKWKTEYMHCIETGEKPKKSLATAYAHPTIKKALLEETYNKCAYCESKIGSVSFGDIEHILPKSERPDLCFEWSNLTLACEKCNRAGKRTYYSEDYPLSNPYVDYPEECLIAAGAYIYPYQGHERAEITINTIKLNRVRLLEERKERMDFLSNLIEKWASYSPEHPLKAIAEENLHLYYESEAKYSFIIKQFLKLQGFPVR